MNPPSLHVGIVSWDGKGAAAREIADYLDGRVGRLTVVYSNSENKQEHGAGDWVFFENREFFGPKFRTLLSRTEEDVLLLIHADASSEDWPALLERCITVLNETPDIGIWSPQTRYSPYDTDVVCLDRAELESGGPAIVDVIRADGIVCAFRKSVVDRLNAMDFTGNNLGWGVDLIAAAYCLQHGLRVVHDRDCRVSHPKSRGYSGSDAFEQMKTFLRQATQEENLAMRFIEAFSEERRLGLGRKLPIDKMATGQILRTVAIRLLRPAFKGMKLDVLLRKMRLRA